MKKATMLYVMWAPMWATMLHVMWATMWATMLHVVWVTIWATMLHVTWVTTLCVTFLFWLFYLVYLIGFSTPSFFLLVPRVESSLAHVRQVLYH